MHMSLEPKTAAHFRQVILRSEIGHAPTSNLRFWTIPLQYVELDKVYDPILWLHCWLIEAAHVLVYPLTPAFHLRSEIACGGELKSQILGNVSSAVLWLQTSWPNNHEPRASLDLQDAQKVHWSHSCIWDLRSLGAGTSVLRFTFTILPPGTNPAYQVYEVSSPISSGASANTFLAIELPIMFWDLRIVV